MARNFRTNKRLSINPMFGANVNIDGAIEKDNSTSFKVVCLGVDEESAHAPSLTKQDLKCIDCGNTDKSTFKKGKDQGDGTVVVVEAAAIADAVDVGETKDIMQLAMHPLEQVLNRSLPGAKVYYLTPSKGNDEAYAIIAQAIEARPDIAFCTIWTAASVPAMYRVQAFDGVLTLQEVAWPEQVKERPDVPRPDLKETDLSVASLIIDTMVEDFDPSEWRDTRKDQIRAVVDAATAIEGSAAVLPTATTGKMKAGSVDLSGSLEAALAVAQGAKGKRPTKPTKKAAAKAPAKRGAKV